MKTPVFLILLSCIAIASLTSLRQSDEEYANEYVVFAGASTNFYVLDSIAKRISAETDIKYENDLVYDIQRGMIVPDTSNDEIYAGSYFPRRYAEEHISIEMAGYYKSGNFHEPDSTKTMTIVTGIFSEKKEAIENLNKVKKTVPDAYVKMVKLYQGCMH